ncbi:MAG: methylmalonyl-CoA mutase family protein [Acidobacteriota bacterium]|nr:methylmalonyl-CoA mutase family protein [Acidobacteriota bacterium]
MTDDNSNPRTTPSGLRLDVTYRPTAASLDEAYRTTLGDPGEFPYTRGLYREMYRKRLWTMRQYAGFGDADESNRRYKFLLDQGITGLSVAFDLPTQIGYDSDHVMARGEVGKVGVAIDSIDDMRRLFADIPLERVTTSMTINSTAATLLALYLVLAEERGVPWSRLGGTVQNDILKEYAARGTFIFPPPESMRLVADVISFCALEVPKWNPISISGYHMREAGCTAIHEVAFTLANALAYVEAVLERGLEIDDFAPRLSFFFNAHNNFLEEVAKFRAARRLWAELVRERFDPRQERSLWLRFHTQTAGSALTAQQPENNAVRVAIQALAAICGGTQSLHTNANDEAIALPTERSAQLALRTQQILAHETGIADIADPLGGAYAIEALTDEIVRYARDYLRRIDALGGPISALEQGFQQDEIANAAYSEQIAMEKGERKIVGINVHRSDMEAQLESLTLDAESEQRQIERLRAFRAGRSEDRLRAAGLALRDRARGSDNLMPALLECVRAGATVGEVSDELRGVFGEHHDGDLR